MDLDRRTVDAIRLARDELRIGRVADSVLSSAAILVAKAIVDLEVRAGRRELRAAALSVLDGAGRTIAAEMRRRSAEAAA